MPTAIRQLLAMGWMMLELPELPVIPSLWSLMLTSKQSGMITAVSGLVHAMGTEVRPFGTTEERK